MIEKIDILQHREGCHLGFHFGEEAAWFHSIVVYHHRVVILLRKDGLDSLSEVFGNPCRWSPAFLVQSVLDIKGNVCCFKQIQLGECTQVALVSQNHALAVLPIRICEILQVMHVGSSHVHVEGACDSSDATQGMKLISVIVHVLRCTVAPRGCMLYVILSPLTPVGTCILADLYRLGVNTEDRLSSSCRLGYGLTDILAKHHGFHAALVVLPMRNQVWNDTWAFCIQSLEKIILTVNTQCLCCEGKSHHLPIGEFGYDTVSRNNSLLIYLISCKFLADFKNFTELCDEVVHIYDNST